MEKEQPFVADQQNSYVKRRGTIPLAESNGPPEDLYGPGLRMLTIGDGDLSFSLAIINWLQYQHKKHQNKNQYQKTFLLATTYDSLGQLQKMYKHIITKNLKALNKIKNVSVRHQVDVNQIQHNQHIKQEVENGGKFDRIIWNFPHAGFPEQEKGQHIGPGFQWEDNFHEKHINIIERFFKSGQKYLKENGLMIVTHKTIQPFSLWNIPKIGVTSGLQLVKQIPFNIDDYPGYQNRRGAGKCAGKRFPCEDAKTYVFQIFLKKQQFYIKQEGKND